MRMRLELGTFWVKSSEMDGESRHMSTERSEREQWTSSNINVMPCVLLMDFRNHKIVYYPIESRLASALEH